MMRQNIHFIDTIIRNVINIWFSTQATFRSSINVQDNFRIVCKITFLLYQRYLNMLLVRNFLLFDEECNNLQLQRNYTKSDKLCWFRQEVNYSSHFKLHNRQRFPVGTVVLHTGYWYTVIQQKKDDCESQNLENYDNIVLTMQSLHVQRSIIKYNC